MNEKYSSIVIEIMNMNLLFLNLKNSNVKTGKAANNENYERNLWGTICKNPKEY